MENPKVLIYDGSFNGFLTTVYKIFEEKIPVTDIQKNRELQKGLFSEAITVFTQMDKARRVWNSIQNKSNAAIKSIYFAFLSETKGIELLLYQYIRSMYANPDDHPIEGISDIILRIQQHSRMVAREKHRIEAIANFEISQDQVFFSIVSPAFDVLPLISKYFRSKFQGQEFIIYDQKRKYAIFYNLYTVEIISMELSVHDYPRKLSQTHIKQFINNKLHPHSPYSKRVQLEAEGEKAAV
ncbi:TIGR03915 family putative DNA repair protein [Arenibacter sp. M-2]|uniref:TIGR03915 family putative DNA repair protein n=1 Tax=unclassified Arenibacter TaxID=2615047 RepID=UPI000D757D0F|nr:MULTISPECIES: TIGR03915 family putative DNA repair protein [unclassified Arenibacter]MDL5511900.1 TIGR03915 family putative DNA repair protein [Arenibacter sp. M-2]PXX25600.1 putative DNA metabolism protein [Arenibacter sp. ARW7G5Y1]